MIDTHAHLNDSKFDSDIDDVISRAETAGVERIIVCGYDMPSSQSAVDLADRYSSVFATVGIHPHDAKNFNDEALQELTELSRNDKVIAIGEIGLDFHYDFSPRPDQFKAFEAQIDLANKLSLPIVIHSRESNPEALQVLKTNIAKIDGCVFHCFSGDEDCAREVLELGFYIGVDGPLTFKNSAVLRRVVEICPQDRLLIETDCPYLTPLPYRGKRNEPAYLRYVIEEVARIWEISVEQADEITTQNAHMLFREMLQD